MMHLDQIVELLKDFAPALALLAALVRVVPVIIVATKSRSRSRGSSLNALRVKDISTAAPWDKYENPWPRDWDIKATRVRYRRKERIGIWVLLLISLVFAGGYGALFYDDVFNNDLIKFRSGSGLLAGPACVLFLAICGAQIRFLWTIRGEHGLMDTLYGADASITVTGDLNDVRQYCLGALYDSGSNIVSCTDSTDASGRTRTEIVAATGLWPPYWTTQAPFQLISFRGEKIQVNIDAVENSEWRLSVRSDNMDPGVDEGSRANKRNIRAFIDAWAFFPDHFKTRDAD